MSTLTNLAWDQKAIFNIKHVLATDFESGTWLIFEIGWKLSMDMHYFLSFCSISTLFAFTLLQF